MIVFDLLCIIFMLVACLYLYFDNQKLREQLEKLELKINDCLEKRIIPDKDNLISLNNISDKVPNDETKQKEEKKISIVEEKKTNEVIDNKYKARPLTDDIYELNIPKKEVSLNQDTTFNPFDYVNEKESNNKDYLKEVSNNLSNSLNPSIIQLTDYEQEEEDQAIISYQELLDLKEKENNDNLEDRNFIDNLKDLRNYNTNK